MSWIFQEILTASFANVLNSSSQQLLHCKGAKHFPHLQRKVQSMQTVFFYGEDRQVLMSTIKTESCNNTLSTNFSEIKWPQIWKECVKIPRNSGTRRGIRGSRKESWNCFEYWKLIKHSCRLSVPWRPLQGEQLVMTYLTVLNYRFGNLTFTTGNSCVSG